MGGELRPGDPGIGVVCPKCGGKKYRYSRQCRVCQGSSRRGVVDPRFLPTAEPSAELVAWAAGFFEGEGSVGEHGGTLRVSIGQKQRWPLDQVRIYFGGSVTEQKHGMHLFVLHGRLAQRFMARMSPWLSPRRLEQWSAALNKLPAWYGEVMLHENTGSDTEVA